METKNNDMDDLFRQSFENFEQEPPEELKALIDKQLKFKTKRSLGGFWYFGIAAIILGVSVFIYLGLSRISTPKRSELAQNTSPKKQLDTFSSNSENKNTSNLAIQANSTQSISKDSSNNSTSTNIGIKINETKDQKITSKNNSTIKNNPLNERTSSSSTQKNNKFSNKKAKIGKKISRKNRNSKKSNKTMTIQNLALENGNKSQHLSRKSDEIAKETDKSEGRDINPFEEAKANNLSSKIDSSANSISSVQLKESAETKDSTKVTNPTTINKTPTKTSPFLLAFKTDYLIPLGKQNENDLKFSTNNAFHFQLEATYLLRSSLGINSGINYFSSSQSFSKTTLTSDSTITGFSTNYIYADSVIYFFDSINQVDDSIVMTFVIDSTSTANYEVSENSSTQSTTFKISSYSIPILFYYNQKLGTKLSVDIMAGGILNFQQIKFRDASNPLNSDLSLSKFGLKAILKTSLRYQFNHFGVSLNNNLVYDLKPIQYQSTKARKVSYGVGVGVFWKL